VQQQASGCISSGSVRFGFGSGPCGGLNCHRVHRSKPHLVGTRESLPCRAVAKHCFFLIGAAIVGADRNGSGSGNGRPCHGRDQVSVSFFLSLLGPVPAWIPWKHWKDQLAYYGGQDGWMG
jgi:hypothetical protein